MVMSSASRHGSCGLNWSSAVSATSIHAASNGSDTIMVTARSTSTTLDCPDSTPANSPATCTVRVADTDSGTKTAPQDPNSIRLNSNHVRTTATVSPFLLTANPPL